MFSWTFCAAPSCSSSLALYSVTISLHFSVSSLCWDSFLSFSACSCFSWSRISFFSSSSLILISKNSCFSFSNFAFICTNSTSNSSLVFCRMCLPHKSPFSFKLPTASKTSSFIFDCNSINSPLASFRPWRKKLSSSFTQSLTFMFNCLNVSFFKIASSQDSCVDVNWSCSCCNLWITSFGIDRVAVSSSWLPESKAETSIDLSVLWVPELARVGVWLASSSSPLQSSWTSLTGCRSGEISFSLKLTSKSASITVT